MDHDQIVGRIGRVTGTIRPDHFGEVMLALAGGTEAYYAKPFDEVETIAVGHDCIVMEYLPPRLVLVTAVPT